MRWGVFIVKRTGLKPRSLLRFTIQKLVGKASIATRENSNGIFLAKKTAMQFSLETPHFQRKFVHKFSCDKMHRILAPR